MNILSSNACGKPLNLKAGGVEIILYVYAPLGYALYSSIHSGIYRMAYQLDSFKINVLSPKANQSLFLRITGDFS